MNNLQTEGMGKDFCSFPALVDFRGQPSPDLWACGNRQCQPSWLLQEKASTLIQQSDSLIDSTACRLSFPGDYFGILMEAKVTSFPFNVIDNPMYWGSTFIYFGWSLM